MRELILIVCGVVVQVGVVGRVGCVDEGGGCCW